MTHLKMNGDFYDDVQKVNDAIGYLHDMIEYLERERMELDKGKVASGLFIRINGLKREVEKMVADSEQIVRKADIERFGPLSKYIRTYLG